MPRQGESLGKYRLVRRIGMGGMAEVWQAKVTGPGGFAKNLVVKTVLEHHAQNQEFIAQFFDEARLAALLTHPNIAQIFELGDHEGIFYIAMEHVRGKDMQELRKVAVAREGGLPFPILARIACGVCEGLHYAHELADDEGKPLDLVHRDVSPENILISFDGVVKLVDFGIAKATITQVTTRAGLFKGKLQYAAPQRLLNEPIDRTDDLYSLGSVLYKAATGQTPIQADSDGAMIKKILDGDFPRPREVEPAVPEEFEKIILGCMEWDPADRYQTARDVQRDLERFIAATGQPVTTFEVSQFIRKCFADELDPSSSIDIEALDEDIEEEAPPPAVAAPVTVFGLAGQKRQVSSAEKTRMGHAIDARPAMPVPTEPAIKTDQLMASFGPRRLRGLIGLVIVVTLLALGVAIGVWAPWRSSGTAEGAEGSGDAQNTTDGADGADAAAAAAINASPADASQAAEAAPASDADSTEEPLVTDASDDAEGLDEDDAEVARSPSTPDISSLLPDEAPRGTLALRGPTGCTAQLGEHDLGNLPLEKQLPVGDHEINVRCSRGIRRVYKVSIREGETTNESLHLGEGTLHVLVRPWAEVTVNGRKMGITPMAPFTLPEGRHSVRLVNNDLGVTKTRRVRIRPGQQTTLRVRLR